MKYSILITLSLLLLGLPSLAQNTYPSTGATILDNKIGFRSGVSDGRIRGIWLWNTNDANHVIYSAASSGISPAGNNAADGLWDAGHRFRFRTASIQGFLFENNDEVPLVDIDASNGNLKSIGVAHFQGAGNNYFAGNIGIGTITPKSELEVNGNITLARTNKISFLENVGGNYRAYIRSTNGENGEDFNSLIFSVGNGNESMIIDGIGRTGIGTTNPSEKLHVDGNIRVHATSNDRDFYIRPGSGSIDANNATLCLNRDSDTNVSLAIGGGNVEMVMGGGNVGIGTNNPQNKLSVEGTIWAKKVKVSLTDGADWVFEEDYELPSLEEVETYIKENKHLPGIPSAEEFKKNDLDVAQMDNMLLQKVEELTLYMIEQSKEVKSLKVENARLREELEIIKSDKN